MTVDKISKLKDNIKLTQSGKQKELTGKKQ